MMSRLEGSRHRLKRTERANLTGPFFNKGQERSSEPDWIQLGDDSEKEDDVMLDQLEWKTESGMIGTTPMRFEFIPSFCLSTVRANRSDMYDPYVWEVSLTEDMCEKEQFGTIDYDQVYLDENSWGPLDPALVRQGEQEEMERFHKMGVYDYCSRQDALQYHEGKFIKVKWVRINKGTTSEPKVRCRLVCQELGYGTRDDELYAGTPALSIVKMMISRFASSGHIKRTLAIIDVKCAFLYGDVRRKIYIELPSQDEHSGGDTVGILKKAMYGTRDAPQIWRATVDKYALKLGFKKSALQPGVYFHSVRDLWMTVHVDDFLLVGATDAVEWFRHAISADYDITYAALGAGPDKSVKYLNRVISMSEEGVKIEGDEKHVKILLNEWGLIDSKGVDTPVVKDEVAGHRTEPMTSQQATLFRRGAARVNYMSQDRPDLSVASRMLSQRMSNPMQGDEIALKRVIIYLRLHPTCATVMSWQSEPEVMTLLVDADWAGCQESRKSTSGGCILLGNHLVSHWSKLQGTIALSSGEAELNSAVKGVSEAIGLKELCHAGGYDLKVQLGTDASVCKSILLRHGCGKIKHLSIKQLWVQGAVESYGIKILKIPRDWNGSDLLTHPVSKDTLYRHLVLLGCTAPPHPGSLRGGV